MNGVLDAWFVREVLVQEGALTCLLHRHWRDHDEVVDLRQRIYGRVYEAAVRQRADSSKSFLFATVRHLLAERVPRQRIVSITAVGDLGQLNVLKDELDPSGRLEGRNAFERLAGALERLSDRRRQVVWLRRVEGLPQKEIARRLGISRARSRNTSPRGSG